MVQSRSDFIKEVKKKADILVVAEQYGVELNRAHKAVCPFHSEKTASLSISPGKQIWKCFGCGKGGDCISLVAELLKVNQLEAAKDINSRLKLGLTDEQPRRSFVYDQKRRSKDKFKEWELKTFILLCDYWHLLRRWERLGLEDSKCIEAINSKDRIEYLIDEIFINGSDYEKIQFWKYGKKEVEKIESRLRTVNAINE